MTPPHQEQVTVCETARGAGAVAALGGVTAVGAPGALAANRRPLPESTTSVPSSASGFSIALRLSSTSQVARSLGTLERSPGGFNSCPYRATLDVVIDHSHRLHESINGGGTNKGPAPVLEGFAQISRLKRLGD